jgi:hypothetical protein
MTINLKYFQYSFIILLLTILTDCYSDNLNLPKWDNEWEVFVGSINAIDSAGVGTLIIKETIRGSSFNNVCIKWNPDDTNIDINNQKIFYTTKSQEDDGKIYYILHYDYPLTKDNILSIKKALFKEDALTIAMTTMAKYILFSGIAVLLLYLLSKYISKLNNIRRSIKLTIGIINLLLIVLAISFFVFNSIMTPLCYNIRVDLVIFPPILLVEIFIGIKQAGLLWKRQYCVEY